MLVKRFRDFVECNPTVRLKKGQYYGNTDIDSIKVGLKYTVGNEPIKYTGQSGSKFSPGDTIMARITPCLENGKIAMYVGGTDSIGSTELFVFRAIPGISDKDYIYYFMKQRYVREYATNSMTGASGRQRADIKFIRKMKCDFPELEEQEKIGAFLSLYDDLIENNNKRIKILEQMAEELYKEWFVRFRFPGYENVPFEHGQPQKWELVRLQEIIDFDPLVKLPKNGIKVRVPMAALSTSSMLLDTEQYEYTESCSGSRFKNGDTLLAKITPCLENGKTAFVGGLESSEGAVGSTEYIVMRGKKINSYMVYLLARSQWFRQSAVNSMNGSDGRQRADVKFIKKLKCLLPDEETIENFGALVKPIFDNVYLLRDQNISLRKQRDALLPRLLSGKLEVK